MGTCIESHRTDRTDLLRPAPKPIGNATTQSVAVRIHQLFENQVEHSPTSLALVFEDQQLTYGELNARANQLAHFLQKRGVGPEALVALRVERSIEMIVGILGILKAGGAYLPLDPAYPLDRQQAILQDAQTKWLLTQNHLPSLPFAGEIISLNSAAATLALEPDTNPASSADADNLAYSIYTSGSTGTPKGVLVTHGNLLHSTLARFRYYAEPVERFLLLSSHAFDSSVAGIFWTLCQRGALILPHEYSRQTAFELADLIARHRITHLLCLPSLYSVLLDQFSMLQSLKTVVVAGESCPAALVARHHALVPGAALFNEYGPTEATVWSTVYRCENRNGSRTVPIGKAIPNAQIYLLDELLRPALNGASGEVYVGGDGVARGYFNRPELTAAKFIPDPFSKNPGARLYRTGDLARLLPDGNLEFLGRLDNQIKIRGHRIELDEIEAVLKEHPSVQDAAVIAFDKTQPAPVNGEAEQLILRRLSAMNPADAERILSEIETVSQAAETGSVSKELLVRQLPEFDLTLNIKRPDFIQPPRDSQRNWLLNRTLDEFEHDLRELDSLAKHFVPGADAELATLTSDRTQAELSEQEILEDWHLPLMKSMARAVTESHGNILEIGFGRGLASSFIQACGVKSHTIIECNDSVIRRFFEPWRARLPDRDIRLARGKWQDVIETLGEFDGIFFQTYPLNEREFAEYLSRSVVFAEHFFPIAARHLRPGGAFTYLTHEIDSLSRRHQRLILQHFSSLSMSVERLQLPADCKDLWWSDSMVVVKAVK
ncbi:MAG TPA: amino acid adenylation domain-containing protein [Verrucomicrobiae bacterium]|nr:amino acid adenylation domain-containing protein [Verrucomicrobiae bacterium]